MSHRPVTTFNSVCSWLMLALLAIGFCGVPLIAQDAAAEPVAVEGDAALNGAPAANPNAARVGRISTNVIDMIHSLGFWNIPFAVASVVFLWFTVDRLVALRRGRVIPKPFVQRFIRLLEDGEMEQDEALQVCLENQSPIANIFAHAVRKWGKPSVEVEQAIIDGGERQVAELRTNLRVLHGIHTITPMMGLLGTVWGMLDSFSQIAFAGAMGQTDQLAQGIALALVTTVVGLVIAIPALVAHMYFSGKIDALVMEMDDLSQRVVHCISAEGLMSRMVQPKRPASAPEPVGARAKR